MHLPRNAILSRWLASRDEGCPILPHHFKESQIISICSWWRKEECLQIGAMEGPKVGVIVA